MKNESCCVACCEGITRPDSFFCSSKCEEIWVNGESCAGRPYDKSTYIHEMCLCEQNHIILRPNELYRFTVVEGCKECEQLANACKHN